MSESELSKSPTPDPAEDNAFFPSAYSLSQYTSDRTDFGGVEHAGAYTGGRWKILMIATDERYLLMDNGTMFSTGNHPVEMLLPLHHLMAAGFDVDVATITGNPAKLELWAMPGKDDAVQQTYADLKPKLKEPLNLREVIVDRLGPDSDYLAVFFPGGHGAEVGIPFSPEVGQVLNWALENDRFVITLCHGPAACWRPRSARRSHRSRTTASAFFPMRSTRGPTRRWVTYPAGCGSSSGRRWRIRVSRSSMTR